MGANDGERRAEWRGRRLPKTRNLMSKQKSVNASTPASGSVRASDPLKPSAGVLIKLGSIAVHCDEMNDYGFDQRTHEWLYDLNALQTLLRDEEVKAWIAAMTKMAFVPVKR